MTALFEEKLIATAVLHHPTGKIGLSKYGHWDALGELLSQGVLPGIDSIEELNGLDKDAYDQFNDQCECGYSTDEQEFISRTEGEELAVRNGQTAKQPGDEIHGGEDIKYDIEPKAESLVSILSEDDPMEIDVNDFAPSRASALVSELKSAGFKIEEFDVDKNDFVKILFTWPASASASTKALTTGIARAREIIAKVNPHYKQYVKFSRKDTDTAQGYLFMRIDPEEQPPWSVRKCYETFTHTPIYLVKFFDCDAAIIYPNQGVEIESPSKFQKKLERLHSLVPYSPNQDWFEWWNKNRRLIGWDKTI
jgi:hypothetical protein